MGVLDTFTFLLKADARQAEEGIENVGEAFEDLKTDGKKATQEIEHNTKSMGGVIHDVSLESAASFKAMAAGMLGAVAAGASLNSIIDQIGQQAQRGKDALSVGVDVGKYQQLEYAFSKNNLEADDLRDTLFDINEFAGDDGKTKAWQALGVSVKDSNGNLKTADELFSNLAASVEGLSKGDATAKLRALGINDPRVIQTIMQGNKELQRQMDIRKSMGLQSKEDTENAQKFQSAVQDLGFIFDAMGEKLAASLAPALTAVVEGIQAVVKWAQDHKGFLIGFFGALSFVAIPALITSLGTLAAAAWTAMLPFLPFIAIAAALGLVIDDLWNYFSGGDSVIGELADKFPALKQFLADSAEEVNTLIDAFKAFMTDPQAALDGFSADMKAWWAGLINDSQTQIDGFIAKVVDGFNDLTEKAKAPFIRLFNWIKELFGHIGDAVSEKIGEGIEKVKGAIKALPGGEKLLNAFGADEGKPATTSLADVKNTKQSATHSPGGADMAVPGDAVTSVTALPDDVNPINSAAVPAMAANVTIASAASVSSSLPSTSAQMLAQGRNTGNVSNSVNVEKIEVNANETDPRQVADHVGDAIGAHLQNSGQHYDDGRSH